MKKLIFTLLCFGFVNQIYGLMPGFEENITITSSPSGAIVSLSMDGGKHYKKIGNTPLTSLIRLGSKIKIEKEGFDTYIGNISMDVFTGLQLNVKLEKIPEKKIFIDSLPKEAEVYIKMEDEFQYMGKTPLSLMLKTGKKQIKVIKKGYKEYWGTLDSEEGKNYQANLNEETHPGFYSIGNSKLKINCVPAGKVYLLDKNTFLQILTIYFLTELKKQGKYQDGNVQMAQTVKERLAGVLIDSIQKKDRDKNKAIIDWIYSIADLQQNSPVQIENIKENDYYVWAEANGMISYQDIHLSANESKEVSFDLRSKFLTIDSDPPGAKIYYEGILQKYVTPITFSLPVKQNSFHIKVSKEGYEGENGESMPSQTVNLYQGDNKKVVFKMRPIAYGYLNIDSSQENSAVYINTRYIGKTPLNNLRFMPNQKVIVRVSKEGYEDEEKEVIIEKNITKDVDFSLSMKWNEKSWRLGAAYGEFQSGTLANPYENIYGIEFAYFPTGDYLNFYWNTLLLKGNYEGSSFFYGDISLGVSFSFVAWRLVPFIGTGVKMSYLSEEDLSGNYSKMNIDIGYGFEANAGATFLLSQSLALYFKFGLDKVKGYKKEFSNRYYSAGFVLGWSESSYEDYSSERDTLFYLFSGGYSNLGWDIRICGIFYKYIGLDIFQSIENGTSFFPLGFYLPLYSDKLFIGTEIGYVFKKYVEAEVRYLFTIGGDSFIPVSLQAGYFSGDEKKWYAGATLYLGSYGKM
ncbi:MAG TPA: hypothetical protein DHW82_12390 [Spirochaetia bacterium]|nr:MAG: hypothetical protein A2Y41_11800 [Spirochaetes bacterium GWB1_36_13]HCL57790.1 hypothetical protein [Spirochaetia bacterium]